MAPLLNAMIKHRWTYHLRRDELTEYRMWRAAGQHLCTAMGVASSSDNGLDLQQHELSVSESDALRETFFDPRASFDAGEGNEGSALNAFLLNYRFTSATDYGTRGDGLPPLLCAALHGSAVLVQGLLEAHADPNHAYRGLTVLPSLGLIPGGQLPLHMAVGSTSSDQATMRALLTHGADPNATVGDLAATPLVGGVFYDSAEGIRALSAACAELGMGLDLERGLESVGWSPLILAAYSSQPETVRALVEIGCDRGAVGDNGYSILRAACENPRMDPETLDLLWNNGSGGDLNESVQPRTAFWHALANMSEVAAKCGGAIPMVSGLAKAFGDLRGSTPLHGAAKAGRLDIVEWLVKRGASRSLQLKTTSGATPVALAERSGHFAVVSYLIDQVARCKGESLLL